MGDMPTSRQQVLEYIRAQHVVSAGELSRAMQMTEANARYHLNLLIAQGLVSQVGQRPAQNKGRPIKLYGLSEQISGHNLNRLAGVLLDELMSDLPEEERLIIINRLALRLHQCTTGMGSELTYGATLTQRLNQVVHWLNRFNYEARWEAHTLAPRVILDHCPYAALIDQYPELCQMDRALLGNVVGVTVEQKAKQQPDRRGIKHCVFAFKK